MTRAEQVDYSTLDQAKRAFIEAGRKTLRFAERFGFVPGDRLGASANVFCLDLKPFFKAGADSLSITLIPEGLGTADDARPDDLSSEELREFWRNIAYKTVATMTNDAASAGLQPVLLSLYLPSSTPAQVFSPAFMQGFLPAIVEACERVGCVYFSGETPELRGKIVEGKLDIAGAVFALTPPGAAPVSSARLGAGHSIVFVESSGPHENGFTALRKLASQLPQGYRTKLPSGTEYWRAINAPSVLYAPLVQALINNGVELSNIEPITGHGWQKLMRPAQPLKYVIEQTLPVPEVFQFVQSSLGSSRQEMISVFNYGVGMALFTPSSAHAEKIVSLARSLKINAIVAGQTAASDTRVVEVKPWNVELSGQEFKLAK